MRNLLIYRYINEVARSGSVRKAAEILSITPSSLNRRIQFMEEELGTQLFERNAKGLRLNPAGELAIHAFRKHLAEVEELKNRIEDLKGARRGVVSIVCSQALLPHFLPRQILRYQEKFPGVEFQVNVADIESAKLALTNYEADLALTFSTYSADDLEVVASIPQSIYVIMPENHPLTRRTKLRLSHCAEFALALNDGSYAIRNMLDAEARRSNIVLRPAIETDSYILLHNYILSGNALGFEIEIGLPEQLPEGLLRRRLDLTVSNERSVHLAQLRGRTLPVSAAKFAEQVNAEFQRIGSD
ncbi:MAG: LysR family transcriptional regulator [Lentilitoribacter sp.]